MNAHIRLFDNKDIPEITRAFEEIGWNKPAALYEQYFMEQTFKTRSVYIALVKGIFAGYLTICWRSSYENFRKANIPEIMDFNILPKFRRMGIGTQLMDRAEEEILRASSIAGIGVGMTADYGAAQRLYVRRGYVPDGQGLNWRHHSINYGEVVTVDDDLVLYLTKELK